MTQYHRDTMNTLEKIGPITLAHVAPRLEVANRLMIEAAARITSIAHRHKNAAVIIPADLTPLEMPNIPAAPMDVLQVIVDPSSNAYWHTGDKRHSTYNSSCRSNIFRPRTPVRPEATPTALVAAIHAADAYAAEVTQLADDYEAATRAAIAKHTEEQTDAVRELIGLVAQV